MKVTIRLRYHTRFGQSLHLCGDHKALGAGSQQKAVPLRYVNREIWETTLEFPDKKSSSEVIRYFYLLRNPDGSVVEDFGGDHQLVLSELARTHTVILDSWNDMGAVENVFATEPFRNVLLRSEKTAAPAMASPGATHFFRIKAPLLPQGQVICLLGGSPALADWSQASPLLLKPTGEPGTYGIHLDLSREQFPVAYKYGLYDLARNTFVRFETGDNRTLSDAAPLGGNVVVNDGFLRIPPAHWHGAGVAIPVFSLRSAKSFGVGEFADLPLLADWAKKAGLKLIQILPVNDTIATHTWVDSYPYAAISAFALHPLYLNLDKLPTSANKKLLTPLARLRKSLNALDAVDYEAVMKAKLAFVRKIFPLQKVKTFAAPEYKEFFAANESWLVPYAAFCCLRDKFGSVDFTRWPEHRSYNAKKIAALAKKDSAVRKEMELQYFIQFNLHLQLREAADYLHKQGLILKGDIAIGVYRHGADVWQQPELYHTDMQAGAPPDAFAAKGQNWGFPTYNWHRMKEDGFDWWKRRFAQMSSYFDAFRIDHILGFFRIWSIPQQAVEGILGYFEPAVPVEFGDFAALGINFNHERFTRPFINDSVLHEVFGGLAETAKRDFLTPTSNGMYALKNEFATQRAVEAHFASAKSPVDEKLKIGLYDLISNVILLEPHGKTTGNFHFRLGMEQTPSFRHLDPWTQSRLKELYVDYFFKRQDLCWMREAMQKLPALKRVTNMLICGEDLGMVPACVPGVMKQLGLLGLEIQRMPKALNVEFSRPADAPYLSVVTPSTHDMSTIRGWWTEDRKLTQTFFNRELRHPGEAPLDCTPWINREVVRQHLDSPAMWSIFQLQDLMGMDAALRRADVDSERINVPAIPKFYWRYRMHLPLEKLITETDFTRLVENLVRQSGR